MSVHPLLPYLLDAASGAYPPVDGGVTYVRGLDNGNRAVVAFTGHAVVATSQPVDELAELRPDGFGAAVDPRFLLALAGDGVIGVHDVMLVAPGTVGDPLAETDRFDDHPRVAHARSLRDDVRVFGDAHGFITIGRGLAGRWEMSVESVDAGTDAGAVVDGAPSTGRRLIAAARHHVAQGTPLFAAVSPGNARSLRAFLGAGYLPIASEVIIDMSPSP